jgi:hypothetical protein
MKKLEDLRKEMIEWKMKEKELADNQNFNGLIYFYMLKWKDTAMYEIPTLYHKISYYYGMLKDKAGFEHFVKEECQVVIGMMATDKELSIGLNLFIAGMNYPHLSSDDLMLMDELFSDENYYELMESIIIDEDLLPRPIKKFDKSILKVNFSNFSDDLLDEVYTSFLENNKNINWYDINVYDRPSNSVIVVDSEDEVKDKTQYIIDFSLRFSEMLNQLNDVLGQVFVDDFCSRIGEESGMLEQPQYYSAGEYAFTILEELIQLKSDEDINAKYLLFARKLSNEWLEKINNLNNV